MEIDPETKEYLERFAGTNQWQLLPVTEARAAHRKWQIETSVFAPEHELERRNVQSRDTVASGPAGDVPLRIYRPEQGADERILPIIMFFHGGGFVIGDLETHDELCRELASRVGAMVIATEYRLAPENKFPAAVEDCVAVTKWVIENTSILNGDPLRIALVGDSAGGNLAAVVALHFQGLSDVIIVLLLLIYPVVDNSSSVEETLSATQFADGFELSMDAFRWFQDQYFGSDQLSRLDSDASPIKANDFKGFAPTRIIVAELDPLADSAIEFAKRLKEDGVKVDVSVYRGAMHAFVTMGSFFRAAFRAADESVDALREAFGL